MDDILSDRIFKIAKAIEDEFGVPFEFIRRLLFIEFDRSHQAKRHGIVSDITKMLKDDYWEATK